MGAELRSVVTISRTASVLIRSTLRLRSSRLVGSSQCASSKIIRIGLERDNASSCRGQRLHRLLSLLLRG